MEYLGIVIGIVVALAIFLRVRRLRAGDLVKVEIPRTATQPLAMGTRLDAAQLLKQRGVPPAELHVLIDGKHDQELLDRYWQASALPAARALK